MVIKMTSKDYYLILITAFILTCAFELRSDQSANPTNSLDLASSSHPTIISIDEEMVINFLTQTLQERCSDKSATLELRLSRPWTPVTVTNKNGSLKLLDAPTSIMPSMIVRLGWQNGSSVELTWQVVVYAKIWADVIVAAKPLVRGTILSMNDISYIKRDILQTRDFLISLPDNGNDIELMENIAQGQLILPRSIRVKPIVRRGQLADAYHVDGALNISLKVEVMEDGASGQYIKIRNPQTRKELKGKVKNDGSIEICL